MQFKVSNRQDSEVAAGRAAGGRPRASQPYSAQELARLTGPFYSWLSLLDKYFWHPLSCVQVGFGLFRDGSMSFIGSLAHCFPRVSICPDTRWFGQ